MRTMAAGEFKAKCLAVMDEVAATGEPVLITKRGKPVVRVATLEESGKREGEEDSLFGFLRGMGTIAEGADLIASDFTVEDWERMADESLNPLHRGKRS